MARSLNAVKIDGVGNYRGLILAITGVMVKKQKKEFDIETKKNKFAAVKTIQIISIGLALLMWWL